MVRLPVCRSRFARSVILALSGALEMLTFKATAKIPLHTCMRHVPGAHRAVALDGGFLASTEYCCVSNIITTATTGPRHAW